MKLISLTMENFLAFKNKYIEFDQTTFIVGPNGSGKSTIVDAILISLYRKSFRSPSLVNLIGSHDDVAKLSLTFKYANKTFRVERFIGKKSLNKHDKLYDVSSDKVIVQGTKNVTDYITALIGPVEHWLMLIPQRQLLKILQPNEFKNLYYQLFQLDKVNLFIKALSRIHTQQTSKIETYRKVVHDLEEQLKQVDYDEKIHNELKNRLYKLKSEYNKLKSEDFQQKLRQLLQKIQTLKDQYKTLQTKLNLISSLDRYRYLAFETIDEQKIAVAFEVMNVDISDLLWSYTLSKDQHDMFITKIKQIQDEYHSYQNVKKELPYALKLKQLYDKYHTIDLKALVNYKTVHLNKHDYQPYAERVRKWIEFEFYNNGQSTEININDLSKLIEYIRKKQTIQNLPELSYDERNLLKSFKSWNDVRDAYNNIIDKFNRYKSSLTFLHTRIDKLNHFLLKNYYAIIHNVEWKSFDELLYYIQMNKDLLSLRSFVSSLSEWKEMLDNEDNYRQNLQNIIKQVNEYEESYKEVEQQADEHMKKLTDLLNRIKDVELQIQMYDMKKQQSEDLQHKIDNYKQELEELIDTQDKCKQYQKMFENFKTYVNHKFKHVIPTYVKQFLDHFGFNFDILIDDDFNIVILKDSKQIPIMMLSGAQQSILALALRLSISKILDSKLPVILDEVTEGFDFTRIDLLKGLINQLSKYHQVIAISHDDRIVSDSLGQIIQLGLSTK